MNKELAKLLYALDAEKEGLKKAFGNAMKKIENIEKETKIEAITENGRQNGIIKNLFHKTDAKLSYICWSLLYKNILSEKEVILPIIEELKKIIKELEDGVNE